MPGGWAGPGLDQSTPVRRGRRLAGESAGHSARPERDLDVTWRIFSLEEANRPADKKHPWEREWSYSWSLLRIAAHFRRDGGGNAAVDRFYEAAGRLLHEQGVPVHQRSAAPAVLAAMGRPVDVLEEALADPATHEEVRADHEGAVALGIYGVPSLILEKSRVLFGPVIAPAPTGDEALRMWDTVYACSGFECLFEIQRPKSAEDRGRISHTFAPFVTATGMGASSGGAGGGSS